MTISEEDKIHYRNIFIDTSFHVTADLDYITSRICLKNQLVNQGLWFGLQAIEKYCKAILVYCGVSVKEFKHDLLVLINELPNVQYFKVAFNKNVFEFIEYLNTYGTNRYFQIPTRTDGREIFKLDWTVWSIRRYCQDWPFLKDHLLSLEDFKKYSEYLNDDKCINRPTKYRPLLENGILEKILAKKEHANLYQHLVWKNLCFGIKKRTKIKIYKKSIYKVPEHFQWDGIWDAVKDFVYFSKKDKKYYENYLTQFNNSANSFRK